MHTITISDIPDAADKDAVFDALVSFNDSKVGVLPFQPLGVFIRDEAGKVIGGLMAGSWAEWLFIERLIVPEELRGQGLGRELMRCAEARARERGCAGIRLDTFTFQARGFYEKLGFRVFGQLENYPGKETRFFMSKRL